MVHVPATTPHRYLLCLPSLLATSLWCAVAGLLSPLFTTYLLTSLSGVPLLEKAAKKKWGDDPGYKAYVASTPVLFPHFFAFAAHTAKA